MDETPAPPRDVLLEQFNQFFPFTNHGGRGSTITYQQGDQTVSFKRASGSAAWKLSMPKKVGEIFSIYLGTMYGNPKDTESKSEPLRRDRIAHEKYENALDTIFPNSVFYSLFIPSGRSFYSQVQANMASFFSKANLDGFVTVFGMFIDRIKHRYPTSIKKQEAPLAPSARSLCEQLLDGRYIREGGEDFIDAKDGRRLPASLWSSGQQEAQPLTAALLYHCEYPVAAGPLFIEEPEAHLFPASQRTMTELIGLAFHVDLPYTRMFITTHSPYILTTINNLLLAGQIYAGASTEIKKALANKVPADRALAPGSVGAFYMDQNGCRSIMDEETGLIGASAIDEVSGHLNDQFNALLDLQSR